MNEKPKTYNIQEKQELVNLYKESGLTQKEFCLEMGLKAKSFANWPWEIRKAKQKKSIVGEKLKFHEVDLSSIEIPSANESIEIRYPSGIELKLPISTPVEKLAQLVKGF